MKTLSYTRILANLTAFLAVILLCCSFAGPFFRFTMLPSKAEKFAYEQTLEMVKMLDQHRTEADLENEKNAPVPRYRGELDELFSATFSLHSASFKYIKSDGDGKFHTPLDIRMATIDFYQVSQVISHYELLKDEMETKFTFDNGSFVNPTMAELRDEKLASFFYYMNFTKEIEKFPDQKGFWEFYNTTRLYFNHVAINFHAMKDLLPFEDLDGVFELGANFDSIRNSIFISVSAFCLLLAVQFFNARRFSLLYRGLAFTFLFASLMLANCAWLSFMKIAGSFSGQGGELPPSLVFNGYDFGFYLNVSSIILSVISGILFSGISLMQALNSSFELGK